MKISLPNKNLEAYCYKIIEQALKNNQSILITRNGIVIAKIFSVDENTYSLILELLQKQPYLTIERTYPDLEWETRCA